MPLGTLLSRLLLCLISLGLALPAFSEPTVIRMATTTSTENSGLLAVLLPPFEQHSNAQVHVIAVGTGKALRLARQGDVDLVLVHARAAEDELVADGFGIDRRDVMHNDFVIVGPPTDPAGIKGLADAPQALARIAAEQQLFVSRGDDSGTHKKETALWRDSGTQPDGQWYREAGQGMGKVLQMAGELDAYTLTDRGTWLAMQAKNSLQVMVEGDPRLFNPYGVIAVNPARFPDANYPGATALIGWLTSEEGRTIIRDFRIQGEPLFIPAE